MKHTITETVPEPQVFVTLELSLREFVAIYTCVYRGLDGYDGDPALRESVGEGFRSAAGSMPRGVRKKIFDVFAERGDVIGDVARVFPR